MTYLYFDYTFMEYFVQNIKAQSSDFNLGADIDRIIKNPHKSYKKIIDKFIVLSKGDGVFFINKYSRTDRGFVFDFENFNSEELYLDQLQMMLLKLFRFCIKKFNNYPLSTYEAHIQNSSCYIVNPFNFYIDEYYKFIIDINPDPKRSEKRNYNVYLNITDGKGYLNRDNYSIRNYRRCVSELATIYSEIKYEEKDSVKSEVGFRNKIKSELIVEEISNYIGYDNWLHYLSEPQRKFSIAAIRGLSRISGPAGSGKTLSLILKAIYNLRAARNEKENLKVGFICHSIAMKENISEKLLIDAGEFMGSNGSVSIEVITLLEWLVENAIKDFKIEDCLEVDSDDMKIMQLLMIENSIKYFMESEYSTYEKFLSDSFKKFLIDDNKYKTTEIIRHEISTYIKSIGIREFVEYKRRANETKIIPWENENDLKAIFRIYNLYESSLEGVGKYDIDDICKVAMGYLPESVWRRNRKYTGYDAILVDEIHLFDFMELQILPYLTKDHSAMNISCAIDSSQSSIDQNLTDENINNFFDGSVSDSNLSIIFRSSEGIINLTKYLFDSKIEIFTTSNPIAKITGIESDDITPPIYVESIDKNDLIDKLVNQLKSKGANRRNCLVVTTSLDDVDLMEKRMIESKVARKVLRRRGDSSLQKKAIKENAVILSYIDFVGGLEFDEVYILGLDYDKVPPMDTSISKEFNEHLWYRKLYVAFTRARYKLFIYSNISSGVHPFLSKALEKSLVTRSE